MAIIKIRAGGVAQVVDHEFKHQYCQKKKRYLYIAQAGLKFAVLLPQPPKNWDYRCAPACPAFV
jgi:hypothetical protein